MNAVVPKPHAARPYVSDQTFLPAALEILETPPSPIRMVLLLLICAFVAVALAWAALGRLDVVAVAQGKISPVGRVKVIQPLQTGKVAAIEAVNGDHVAAGQIVAELDTQDLEAQLADQQRALDAARAEVARREAAVEAVRELKPGAAEIVPSSPIWPDAIPADVADREGRVLIGDLSQLSTALASIEAQLAQKLAEQQGMSATIEQQRGLVGTLQDRATMRQSLLAKDAGSKADWLDAVGNLKVQQVTLSENLSALSSSQASSSVLEREWKKTLGAFVDDNLQKLVEAQKQADTLAQRVRQVQVALDQMTLRSPLDGVVQASILTSQGQVLATGQETMRIVPTDAPIEVEAYLPNADIGFVRAGQKAVVKLEAFPFTRYGVIEGRVLRVAEDAVTAADAQGSEGDSTRSGNAILPGGTQHTANLVFPITVGLDATSIRADGATVPLSPGMGVTVEVNTGNRSILEYVFSPLVETAATALHER